MSAREERLVTENNLWELDTWLDKVDVFAKPHFDYVNGQLVNTGIKFGNSPTRMTAFIGDTIVRHKDGTHTVLSAKDTAELNKLRVQVAEVCGQRDAWHDWADTLAYKVAPVEVLGKHGEEGKFPWDDALALITPAAEVQRLREERHSTNEALDDAVRENAKLRARVAELEQTLERRTELLRDVQKIARKRTNESRGRREYGALLKAENAELKAAAQKVAKFCAARAEYITNLRNCNPDNGHDYDRWQGHAEARRQLSQLLGLPVGWPAEDKPAPVPLPRQTEDPHDGPNHHDYALGRDLPTIPRQTTGRCPQGHTFEDCTCGGTA